LSDSTIWNKSYNGIFNDIIISKNNEIFLLGESKSSINGSDDILFVKTDSKGNIIWERNLDIANDDDVGISAFVDNDNSFIIFGRTHNENTRTDLVICKIDTEGNSNGNKTYDFGNKGGDYIYDVLKIPNDGYVYTGYCWSSVDEDLWFGKIQPDDNEPPLITITSPDVNRGFKPVEETQQVVIIGTATDKSGIKEVMVNGQKAFVDAQGNFTITVMLAVGENSFTVNATDNKNNTNTKQFTIVRKEKDEEKIIENNTTYAGKYYALVIGISDYPNPDIPSLDGEPTNDAKEIAQILTTNYTFNESDVKVLLNPTYRQVIRSFDDLAKLITKDDNLLIFYAGHGYYDEDKKIGYWLPSDAEMGYTDAWLYNSVLVDNIKKINSKHTLLISDACFSGSIFKTRALPATADIAYQKNMICQAEMQ